MSDIVNDKAGNEKSEEEKKFDMIQELYGYIVDNPADPHCMYENFRVVQVVSGKYRIEELGGFDSSYTNKEGKTHVTLGWRFFYTPPSNLWGNYKYEMYDTLEDAVHAMNLLWRMRCVKIPSLGIENNGIQRVFSEEECLEVRKKDFENLLKREDFPEYVKRSEE